MIERAYTLQDKINYLDDLNDLEIIELTPANAQRNRVRGFACQTMNMLESVPTRVKRTSFNTDVENPRLRFVKEYEKSLLQMRTNQVLHSARYPTMSYPGAIAVEGVGKSPLIIQTSTSGRRRGPPIESWSAKKNEFNSSLSSDGPATIEEELSPMHLRESDCRPTTTNM